MSYTNLLKKNIDSLLAAILGACIIWLFTRHGGIGVSPDSVFYYNAADNLQLHGTLTDFNQHPVVEFPALYPVFLAITSLIPGSFITTVAPVVNATLFALVLFLSGAIMEQFNFPSRWYKRLVLSILVVSPSLLEVFSMLWSETIFILLFLAFMLSLKRYLQSNTIQHIAIAAFIAALACVTRFAGVTFIVTGLVMLFSLPGLLMRTKFVHAWLFAGISSSFLLCNLIRNQLVSNTLTGERERAIHTVSGNVHDMGTVFTDWLPFLKGHESAAAITCMVLLILFSIGCWRTLFRSPYNTTYENSAVLFFILYALFMIASASLSRYEPLSNRLLSPLFIPMVWGISSWIPARLKTKWLIIPVLLLYGSFQFYQLKADYETWDGVKDAGIPGYTEDQWKQSPTILYLQQDSTLFNSEYSMYSNAADAVYFFFRQPAQSLPHNEFALEKKRFLSSQHSMVIWFNDGDNPDLVNKEFITGVKKMILYKEFEDGSIYIDDSIPSPEK